MKREYCISAVTIMVFILTGILTACQSGAQPPLVSSEPDQSPTANVIPMPTPDVPIYDISVLINPISSGGETYFAIKDDGLLLGWGRSDSNALGGNKDTFSYEAPNEIMNSVKYVSGGQWVTFVVDSENVLWGTGTDYFGHLGNVDNNLFQMVKIMENVAYASSSQMHSLALKIDNSLWCWGKGRGGIPGEEIQYDNQQIYEPVKIMDDVAYAVATRNGGYAIKGDNSLWEWGIVSPDLVKVMDDVRFVCYGMAIKLNGDLLTWSYTENGDRTEPKLILQDVSCCDQGAAVQNDGSLWVWGDNQFGQLGDGSNRARTEPHKIMDDVAYVAKGNQYTIAVKTDGSLWQSGCMDTFSTKYAAPYQIAENIWLPHEARIRNTSGQY